LCNVTISTTCRQCLTFILNFFDIYTTSSMAQFQSATLHYRFSWLCPFYYPHKISVYIKVFCPKVTLVFPSKCPAVCILMHQDSCQPKKTIFFDNLNNLFVDLDKQAMDGLSRLSKNLLIIWWHVWPICWQHVSLGYPKMLFNYNVSSLHSIKQLHLINIIKYDFMKCGFSCLHL